MDHCEKEKRKSNPRERANICSLVTFVYTGGIFKKALKNDLEEENLYEVVPCCNSKKCGDRMEREFKIEYKKKNPSIFRLMWACFGRKYILLGLIHVFWKIFKAIVEPHSLSSLIKYFKPHSTMSKQDAIYYACVVVGLNLANCIYIHNYILIMQQLAIQLRTSFSSLVYRKALTLTPAALLDVSLGNIVTLITKDVHTFEQSIWLVNDMWIGIVTTITICCLLYMKMGYTTFIGIGILLSIIPVQILLGRWVTKLRLTVGKKTDERLQVTQEVLSSIRIIKMYTWETFFNAKVSAARRKEINSMLKGFYLRVVIVLSGVICSRFGFYILLMSYLWLGNTTTAELVFYALSCFKDLRTTLAIVIPHGLARAAELYASIIRINRVLQADELTKTKGTDEITLKPLIQMKNVSVNIKEKKILENISLIIDSGLTLITGPVGCGKSSLVKTMLQDYPVTKGDLETHGRISYASQDPWLFPSSIKQNILFGEPYNHTRYQEVIRVCALTYDLNLLDKSDETIVADRGINLSKGQQARINLARAVYKESEIYLLDDSLTALDAHVQEYIFNNCIKEFLKDKVVVLVTHSANHISEADNIIILKEGIIKSHGKSNEISVNDVTKLIGEDDDLEKEVIEEEEKEKKVENEKSKEDDCLIETEQQQAKKKVYHEIKKKGSVNMDVYMKYFKFGGGLLLLLLVTVLFFAAQITESYSDKLLTKWIDLQQRVVDLEVANVSVTNETVYEKAVDKSASTLNLYSIIVISSIGISLFKFYSILDLARRASINIHKSMAYTIINSVMSFFDSHFIGNILNRFSQDLNNIDEHLSNILADCFRIFFAIGGIVVLVVTVNWKFIIPIGCFFTFLVTMRYLYLPTGRSLKRLEAATRSPLVGHLNATLEGLTTIRAYKAQPILRDEFDRHQDLYTSAHYTLTCTSRAFGFAMDFLCALLIAIVVAVFILVDTKISAGDVGLVLTQIFALAGLVQWGVRQWADLENQMTSVERALEYTTLTKENRTGQTLSNWPSNGEVKYENVTLTYSNNQKVLKNLNFSVKPKEKIGIVGRTGAGKSSIISTLFRLYDVEGKILIDNVNTKTLSLDFLRQSIAIIPQDPVLFAGTLRTNIDPLHIYSDDDIWKAIERVKIKNLIPSLDLKINENGANFSAGQRQLICLARAIIRNNKIVVLDEATANMDPETDALLHNIIKENFSDCTVFTIAHRLHSVIDSNKIMVLDKGEIAEYDDPSVLLQNKDGLFYQMVKQSGLLPKQ